MHRSRAALAVLVVAGLVATGCGSDDTEPGSDGQSDAARSGKAKPKKRKSARAQMVKCIESELGFDVKAGDDPHRLSVKNPKGKRQAVVIVHPDAAAARRAVMRTLEKEGMNAVAFGRAEFIRHAAGDTEAGVIANCVAIQYNRPRRR